MMPTKGKKSALSSDDIEPDTRASASSAEETTNSQLMITILAEFASVRA
jgi:hypothetical protein